MQPQLLITVTISFVCIVISSQPGATIAGVCNHPATPRGRIRQLLTQQRRLLRDARDHYPSSFGIPEYMALSDLYRYIGTRLQNVELRLANSTAERLSLCRDRLEDLQEGFRHVGDLYFAGAHGGEPWRLSRSECRCIRAEIAVVRAETEAHCTSPCQGLLKIVALRRRWRAVAERYVHETLAVVESREMGAQAHLASLAELRDARIALSSRPGQALEAEENYLGELRAFQALLADRSPEDQPTLLYCQTVALAADVELNIVRKKMSQNLLQQGRDRERIASLQAARLDAWNEYLNIAEQTFLHRYVLWIDGLLEVYAGLREAELDSSNDPANREKALQQYSERVKVLDRVIRSDVIAWSLWRHECEVAQLDAAIRREEIRIAGKL